MLSDCGYVTINGMNSNYTQVPQQQYTEVPQKQLAPIWQRRFAFFSQYGLPNANPQGQAALRAMSFGDRFKINSNILGFLFGPFYFMAKGMWRKGLTLLIAALAVGVLSSIVLDLPDSLTRAESIAMSLMYSMTANYAYFLHVTRGSTSWNPFEGFGRSKPQQR